jgi:hypothetical protein
MVSNLALKTCIIKNPFIYLLAKSWEHSKCQIVDNAGSILDHEYLRELKCKTENTTAIM